MASALPWPSRAAVIGASGGLGGALVAALGDGGFETVHGLSRHPGPGSGRLPSSPIDLLDEGSIAAAARTLREGAPLRLVIVATGLLHDAATQPEKTMRTLDAAQLARSFAVNAIGPALLAKHVVPILPRQGRSVFAVLSARVGSIGDNRLGGWYGYRASKAALNQIVRTLAVETRRTRPEAIVVALHPGTVATTLSAPFSSAVSPERLFTPQEAARHLLRVVDGLTAEQSGGFFAWDGAPVPF